MNKVIIVNLSGNAYQLDEEGYNALREYLDRAEAQLQDSADKREVIADLEQAIAEKCASALQPHKNVVTTAEMTQILNAMGPVQSADGRSADVEPPKMRSEASRPAGDQRSEQRSEQRTDQSSRSHRMEQSRQRRLYRLHQGAKWAGVCAGLSAFSDIHVGNVRGLFIIFSIVTPFVGLIAYIALMFILPVAYTEDEIAAAHARPTIERYT